MIIKSEQDMLQFGENFANYITGRVTDMEGDPKMFCEAKILGRKNVQQDPSNAIVVELIGDVGAGKTTFTRGLAAGLGIKEPVTSPSFTISKSYAIPKGGNLIHYDFYRLPDPGLMSNDLQENLANPNNIVVIEWGNSIFNVLPQKRFIIHIKSKNHTDREVIVKDNQNNTFRDISRPTVSESAKNPVTTATKRVEKDAVRLSLDTSTPETILKLNDKEYKYTFANDLAEKLLQFISDKLAENGKTWHDITEIEFMSGPGSFTGLRIGATVVNTLAHELNVPLKDHHGKSHQQIIPDYGRPAHITPPKK